MPIEVAVWRIDAGVEPMEFVPLDFESRLQDILAKDVSIADPNLMLVGREVSTAYNSKIDLLALNRDGDLVVIELKRDKTPRDIVAQVLDYASWVRTLHSDEIARIFSSFQQKYHPGQTEESIDEAFCKRFGLKEMPEELNESHELIIVASELDPSTERIVNYLAEEHDVNINALFFRVFKDGEKEYLTRAWLREPITDEVKSSECAIQGEWNGEYYVSYGADECRDWEEARKYGYISGGGGSWYTNTLSLLEPGQRIWVNIPGAGYVGVGEVAATREPVDEFKVNVDGKEVRLVDLDVKAKGMRKLNEDPEKAEYLVKVKWIKTVPESQAIKEKGFFGNQNTVARPRTPKWEHTVERLKKRFGLE